MFHRLIRVLSKILIFFKFRLDIIGSEHIPIDGPVIVAANHSSNFDPIILSTLFERKIHFIAKHELFRTRISNWFFQKLHAIPVDRNSGIAIRPVRCSLKVIHSGEIFGIFPEGQRCRNGEIIQPKKGVAFFGLKTGAPILPIALIGVKKGWRQPAKVIIGPLFFAAELNTTNYSILSQSIMDRVRELSQIHGANHCK